MAKSEKPVKASPIRSLFMATNIVLATDTDRSLEIEPFLGISPSVHLARLDHAVVKSVLFANAKRP